MREKKTLYRIKNYNIYVLRYILSMLHLKSINYQSYQTFLNYDLQSILHFKCVTFKIYIKLLIINLIKLF